MKKILIALILVPMTSFASGKITLQDNVYDNGETHRQMVGLNVYESLKNVLPMGKYLAVNAWAGYGVMPLEVKGDVDWLVAKAQVDMYFGKITVSPGYQYKMLPGESHREHIPFIKFDYVLW